MADSMTLKAEQAPKLTIKLRGGELHTAATAVEAAIVTSGHSVFQRGLALVQPVGLATPTSNGRMAMTPSLREMDTTAMLDLMMQCARFERYDGRRKREVPCDPPALLAEIILRRAGRWTFPIVAGVITAPTLRPDGTILRDPGYDAATRLYLMPDPSLVLPEIATDPTREDANAALNFLHSLIDEFPFAASVDRSVALSGLITPVVRAALTTAPLHAIRASTAGTGKSYLVDVISAIAAGCPCPVTTVSSRESETDKRLVGVALAGYPIVSLDNLSAPLGGDLLCQMIERPSIRHRPLGRSDTVEISNYATLFATGNNMSVHGDMARRTLVCTLDAKVERPELRKFTANPLKRVEADRGRYVAACLIIVRAYCVAGRPSCLDPIASFERWSDLVRSALVWLGCEDPAQSMMAAREDDPELTDLRELMSLWRQAFGLDVAYTCKMLFERTATPASSDPGATNVAVYADLRDALLRIAGDRGGVINTKRLGKWLQARKGRIVDGLYIQQSGLTSGGALRWCLQRTGESVEA